MILSKAVRNEKLLAAFVLLSIVMLLAAWGLRGCLPRRCV
nr:MAG TPA: hypothetical protein [Caudoviricetes sp.]